MTSQDLKKDYILEYKGYVCHSFFDEKNNLFRGKVINHHPFLLCEGNSIRELLEIFHQEINDHILWCKKYNTYDEVFSLVTTI